MTTKTRDRITVERIKELLSYDPDTGIISWRNDRAPNIKAGQEAGNARPEGNRRVKIDGVLVYSHHIAWVLHYGAWPTLTVDHEDRNGFNNRIKNLRNATRTEQSQNRIFAKNVTGARGIRMQTSGRFTPQIQYMGKKKALGTYDTLEEAVEVRQLWEEMLFAKFAPH